MIENPQNPANAPQAPRPFWPRLGRAAVIAMVSLSLSILGLIAVSAGIFQHGASLLQTLSPDHPTDPFNLTLVGVVIAVILPAVILFLVDRKKRIGNPPLAALIALVLASFVYLAWDEPTVRFPITMNSLAPAQPGDEATFAVFRRYAKGSPAAAAVKSPKLQLATSKLEKNPDEWIAFLRAHRTEIEAEWADLAPVRAWWDELAAQPRIGDLTEPHPAATIIAFQPVRLYSQLAVAIASLQALDGDGDKAMATVTRLYTVARKFEPNSRTLVRAMIAKTIQKAALQTAAFVLDQAPVSAAARAAFAAELVAAPGGPTGARHLAIIEYAFSQPLITEFSRGTPLGGLQPVDSLQRVIRFFGPIVFNPRATVNLLGERYHLVAELAGARRLKELEDRNHPVNRSFVADYNGKNLGGRLLGDMALPALAKVIKTYWAIDDLRLAMLARLRT